MSTTAIERRGLRAALVQLALTAVAVSQGAAGGTETLSAEELQRRNWVLRQQVDLAASEAFYLVLDPVEGTLALMLRGVVLSEYPVSEVSVGQRRVTFVSRSDAADWSASVRAGGKLEPPRERERVEIRVDPAAAAPTEIPIPPVPTEERTPARYFIRYSGGLALEVVAAAEPAEGLLSRAWNGLAGRLGEAVQALRARDRSRLRIALGREDAAMLYRSLPPETKLFVLPRSTGGSS
jgi:hypothetical protein